jgi:hypothetical protein
MDNFDTYKLGASKLLVECPRVAVGLNYNAY